MYKLRAQRFFLVGTLTLLIMAAILGDQLLTMPIVGLADNGDFARMMAPSGLAYFTDNLEDIRLNYINRNLQYVPPDWSHRDYYSSELLFVKLAVALDQTLNHTGSFDLLTLGFVHLIAFLLAMIVILYGSARLLTFPTYLALCVLIILIFTDVGYVAYFNSLYTETASLIFLAFSIGFALIAITTERIRVATLLYFVAAGLLILAKVQNMPLALPFGLLGLRWFQRVRVPGWQRLVVALGLIGVIGGLAGWSYTSTADILRRANLYSTVFIGALHVSPTPVDDLVALGLPANYAQYINVKFWSTQSPRDDPAFQKVYDSQMTFGKLIAFYALHPDRFLRLAEQVAPLAFEIRYHSYLGNFEKSVGLPPMAESQRFNLWSSFKEQFPFKSLEFLAICCLVGVGITWIAYRRTASPRLKLLLALTVALIAAAVIEYVTALIGEGLEDVIKHLLLFNALFDVCFIVGVLLIFNWLVQFADTAIKRRRSMLVSPVPAR